MTKSRTNADNAAADILGVTAGTGISGGGTSGTPTVSIDTATTVDKTTAQTLTNKTLTSPVLTTPSISTITTKGDLLGYDTALNRVPIGTNNQVLTADSAQALGLKWATAATPNTDKTFTLISTTATTSGSTITISGLSGDTLFIYVTGVSSTGVNNGISLRCNGDSAVKYGRSGTYLEAGTSYGVNTLTSTSNDLDSNNSIQMGLYSSSYGSTYGGVIQILGAASTTGIKPIIVSGGTRGDGSFNANQFIGGAIYQATSPAAITNVSFVLSSGTFDAGSISIFKG